MKRSSSSATDLVAVRHILNRDPAWTAYALADLQPSFAAHCQWYTQNEGVLLPFHALTPSILLTVGEPSTVADLLAEASLPARVFISARPEHLPVIQHYYCFDRPAQGTSLHHMLRMVFQRFDALTDAPLHAVERLQPADAPRIEQLLTHGGPFTPDAFDAYQLAEGVFYGISDGAGKLLAVGGTHIVDWQEGVGAIGNMYTHPDHRGQGYARLILGAIVRTLQEGGAHNLVLNVNQKNSTAIRIYEQYGFAVHCAFVEGIGVR
ncbi:MAG: GNAT family N-acetyltransferase [Caldilineaceae bacterium]|nr:GNAT family N-acetyltransferase [Caldilineaceae bacterium]